MEEPCKLRVEELGRQEGRGEQSRVRRWDRVFRCHHGRVKGRVRRTLTRIGIDPHGDLVEDLAQETYCRLLAHGPGRPGRRTEPELLAYLGRVAESAVIDHMRVAGAGKRNGDLLRLGRRVRRRLEAIPDPRGTPEDHLLWAEQQRLFLEYCEALPSRSLRRHKAWVIRLAVFEGWSSREISQATGGRISAAGVDCLLHRVRRQLIRDGFGRRRP